jgi:Cytosol aminopeptidase family, N-terminal domain
MKLPIRLQQSLIAILFAASAAFLSAQTATLPVNILVQSPAETKADLQIFCLFLSTPENQLHGSLTEANEKLHGLLTRMRSAQLFGGEFGETILLTPPAGTLAAKQVLIIGLGDSATLTPKDMYLVGKIAFREANRLGIAHPFFAPTILDGGVARFTTGEVAEQVVRGFRDALTTEFLLNKADAAPAPTIIDFTFLAGAKHAADTQSAITHALGESATKQP